MNPRQKLIILFLSLTIVVSAQEIIPLDTNNWTINARSYVIEEYKGKNSIYLQAGSMTLKDRNFQNGTIEFDMYLKQAQMFPGLYFRVVNNSDAEQWFVRPHLSGKPDANQAAPATKGITPWQLYFGPRYSFPYDYKYDDWTHVKLVVNGDKAQVFLDYSEKPNLSWNLFHPEQSGKLIMRGGGLQAMHLADIKVDENATELIDFKAIEREPIDGLIQKWEISDMFEEKRLADLTNLETLISERKWQGIISVEEGTAANIARVQALYNGEPGNTVFARIKINSNKDQMKLLEFGYSDRVVAILNGKPIYWGTNKWRSRDYRYLGTVGLFDGVYLDLKKGENELLMAVSEDFGGWLITGRFKDNKGLKISD